MSFLKLLCALFFSLAIHAGLASLYRTQPTEIKMAGGAAFEITSLGDAFSDSIASGSPDSVIEPITQDNKLAKPQTLNAIEANEIIPDGVAISEPDITETKPIEDFSEPVELSSLQPAEQITMEPIVSVPVQNMVPTPKPKVTSKETQKAKKPTKKTTTTEVKKKKTKKFQKSKAIAGNNGKSKTNAKSGTTTGKASVVSKAKGKKKRKANTSGNSKVSNYPGKIVRKLRRALRYPKAAKRKKIRGQVIISFIISKNGRASSIRLARGSGSAILDQAALETVRRAAPFPQIPNEAKRSKWAFKVPLAFK